MEYVRLMLDRHQTLCANGLASESFPSEAPNETAGLFPGLDPMAGAGYGKAARRTPKPRAAALLLNHREMA